MRHVEVSAYDYRLFPVESLEICKEVVLPSHSVVKPLKPVLSIGHIYAHEEELLHFESDDTSLVVMLVNSYAVCDIQWLVSCEDSRTRISLLLGIVPVGLISLKFEVELSRLHLGFLQTEEVGVELLEHIAESLAGASPDSVNIP